MLTSILRRPLWIGCVVSAMFILFAHNMAHAQEPVFIEGIEPDIAQCGETLEVWVFGEGFTEDAQVSFLVEGVEVHYTEFISPNELLAGLSVFEQAPAGRWPVAVQGESGEFIHENAFTILCEPEGGAGIPPEPGSGGEPGEGGGEAPGSAGVPDWLPLLIILVIVVVIGGIGLGGAAILLSANAKAKTAKRRQWQQQAQHGKPPQPCQINQWHCEFDEIEVEFKRSKLTQIQAEAGPEAGQQRHQQRTLSGTQIQKLDRIILMHHLGKRLDEFQQDIATVSGWIAGEIAAWLSHHQAAQHVDLNAQYQGVEVTLKFVLRRCVPHGSGTIWKKVDEWEVTQPVERDRFMGSIVIVHPALTETMRWLPGEVENLLLRYMQT